MVCSKINNNVLYSCIYKKGHSSAFLFEILSPITVILRRAKPTWLPQFRYKINYAENLDVGEYVTMFKFAFCIQQGYDLFTLVNISWLTLHTHDQNVQNQNETVNSIFRFLLVHGQAIVCNFQTKCRFQSHRI